MWQIRMSRGFWGGGSNLSSISKDDSFRYFGGHDFHSESWLGGLLPKRIVLEFPFHILSSRPQTPFWEVFTMLTELLGGLVIVAGDAETTQPKATDTPSIRWKTVANG